MKHLIVLLTVLLCNAAVAQCTNKQQTFIDSITTDQWKILNLVQQVGEPHNLGYTMMGIAWNESQAGKYRVNLISHDFGIMQNSLKTAMARTKTKGYYKKMQLVERLIKDDNLSANLALEELLYWQKHTTNWRHTISAYNNGWKFAKGNEYSTKIAKLVNTFMNCAIKLKSKEDMLKQLEPVTEEDTGNLAVEIHNNETEQARVATLRRDIKPTGDAEMRLSGVWRRNKHQRGSSHT